MGNPSESKSPTPHSEESSEELWLPMALKGDLPAFSKLVQAHQSMIRAYLAERLNTRHEADDLSQEVFITAHRKISEFSADRPLGPWLRGIAFNLLRNHFRKFRANPIGGSEELQLLLDNEFETRASANQEEQRIEALHDCLAKLDGPSRDIVQARYVSGETVREIEKRTKRGYSALTMQLHRIRTSLAQCIEQKVTSSPRS